MITANDLKTKGIVCLDENLADQLETALYESQQDVAAGRFSKDSVDQHVDELFAKGELPPGIC